MILHPKELICNSLLLGCKQIKIPMFLQPFHKIPSHNHKYNNHSAKRASQEEVVTQLILGWQDDEPSP